MFACVVVFGLFHGLFVLPALLSLVGPVSVAQDDEDQEDSCKVVTKTNTIVNNHEL